MSDTELLLVDLIVPAHNEQDNMADLLAALPWGLLRHVIVVDNGSTDRTATLARAGGAMVLGQPRRGYGIACLSALKWIRQHARPLPDAVAFVDADLSDDPALLPKLWEPIAKNRADLVIGSRPKLAQRGALTFSQRVGNAVACRLIRSLTKHRYSDLGPMRVIRWSSLEHLCMQDTTWGWTVEMQYKAALLGLRSADLDVPYRPRRAGVSKISGSIVGSARAGLRIIATIFQLWWRTRGRLRDHGSRDDG